jgi:hypothetical protein
VSRTGPQGASGGGAGSIALDDLTDVALVGTTSGDLLRYNGTAWTDTKLVASDLATGTSGASTYLRGDQSWQTHNLDALTDVALVGATSGDFLRHNGTNWTDATIVASDLGTGTADAVHFLAGDLTWQAAVPLDVDCKNTTASTIPKGTPVYVTGSVGAGATVEVAPAQASAAGTMSSIGLTTSELTANATGYVRVMGVLSGVSTGAYSINQTLYVAAAGGLTSTRPSGDTQLVQNIGRVIRSNNSTGEILILGPGRTNDVPNLIGTDYLASSGTASASTYLRGDQSWSAIAAADVGAVPTSRNVSSGTGLSGGGDLTADRTLSVLYGTTSGTATAGNDARLSDARTPTAHKTSHQSGGSDELALAANQITSGVFTTTYLPHKVVAGQDESGSVTISTTPASILDSAITLPVCAAGDMLMITGAVSINNNSGASRTYTLSLKLGATTVASALTGAQAVATRVNTFHAFVRVEDTSDLNGCITCMPQAVQSGSGEGVATENIGTGTLTLDVVLASAANTTTQSATLDFVTVTKVAK